MKGINETKPKTVIRSLSSTDIIIMDKIDYEGWIGRKGEEVFLINIPALFPCISCKADFLAYDLKGKIINIYDNYLAENVNYSYLEFDDITHKNIWQSRFFLEEYKKEHPDFSENDYAHIIPNHATLIYMDSLKNINLSKCSKEIRLNNSRRNLIIARIFHGTVTGKQQMELENLDFIEDIIERNRTVKGLPFTHQLLSKMEFKIYLARFLKKRKVSAETVVKLSHHMGEHHDDNLLFRIYNTKYGRGYLHDFAQNFNPCCKNILYGDTQNTGRKRKRSDVEDKGQIHKTSKNIAEIGKKIIAFGSRLNRPLIKINVDGLMPFEMVLKFDTEGLDLKVELVKIVEFLRCLSDKDFETKKAWDKVELTIKTQKEVCEFPFTEMIWTSMEAIMENWLLTKNFVNLNFGFQLIIFSLSEEDLNCSQLADDEGTNLRNTLIFPKVTDICPHQLINDEIYMICI